METQMGKAKKEKPKKNNFKSFLRKRAPIYLALVALLVVFVIPEITKGDLKGSLPELAPQEQQILDIVMGYDGADGSGLTVMDAIAEKIEEKYPNEKIYDHKKTEVKLTVTELDSEYRVVLNFKSHKGEMNYDWNVAKNSKEITPNNPESKHIIDVVDFYD